MFQDKTSWACLYVPRLSKIVGKLLSHVTCTLGNIWRHPYLASITISICKSIKTFLCVLIRARDLKGEYWKIVTTMGMSLLQRSLGHLPQSLIIAKSFFQTLVCMLSSATDIISADYIGAIQNLIIGCFKTNLNLVGQGLIMVTDMSTSFIGSLKNSIVDDIKSQSSYIANAWEYVLGEGGIKEQIAVATGLRITENFSVTKAFNSWNKQNSIQFDNYNKVFALYALLNIDTNTIIPLINTIAPGGLFVTNAMIDSILSVFSKLSSISKDTGFRKMSVILQMVAESKENLLKYTTEIKKLGTKIYEVYLLIIQTTEMIKELSVYFCCAMSRIHPNIAKKLDCSTGCCPDYIDIIIKSIADKSSYGVDIESGKLIVTQKSIDEPIDNMSFN